MNPSVLVYPSTSLLYQTHFSKKDLNSGHIWMPHCHFTYYIELISLHIPTIQLDIVCRPEYIENSEYSVSIHVTLAEELPLYQRYSSWKVSIHVEKDNESIDLYTTTLSIAALGL